MVKVKKSYRKYGMIKLTEFATEFGTNLTSMRIKFPAPPHDKTALDAANTRYQTLFNDYKAVKSNYNAEQTQAARATLIRLLDEDVVYVEGLATEDSDVQALGLQPVATGPTKAPLPGKPAGALVLQSEEPQWVILKCDPVKINSTAKVNYYVYETNADGTVQGALMTVGGNSKKLEFGPLTTGKVYFFYIRARTTAGFGPPSNVVRWVGQ